MKFKIPWEKILSIFIKLNRAQQQIQTKKMKQKSFQTKNTSSKPNDGFKKPFQVGETLVVKMHAFGPNKLGLSQLPNGYTVVFPIAGKDISFSDDVRVSIESISSGQLKYATAKVLDISKDKTNSARNLPVQAGEILDVSISKVGPKGSGFAEPFENYPIFVPNGQLGDQLKVQITRVRAEYAFGKPVETSLFSKMNSGKSPASSAQMSLKYSGTNVSENLSSALMQNSQFHLVLPKTSKMYRGYAVVKLNGLIVFIKLALGAKLGDSVRIQTMKVGSNYAVAKIVQVSPLSKSDKLMRAKSRVFQMIQTGMHFGEKAIRCHANMRKYVWYRKKGLNQNRPLLKRDRYYINLLKTRRCLQKALKQLAKYAAKGKTFLFVGTKKSASALIARTALFTKTSFFVNTRWLGGMLTNWKTILKSISQIKPILKEKQKMIQTILEKRQKIKYGFIKKVNLLKKRGEKLMAKGRLLITKLKKNKTLLVDQSQELFHKKQEILSKNRVFIEKYSQLKRKKNELVQVYQNLLQKRSVLLFQKQNLWNQLQKNQSRLKEFKQLFLIGQELLKLKKTAKQQQNQIFTVSYSTVQEFAFQEAGQSFTVPNPSNEILNKMIQSMKMKYENSGVSAISSNQNRSKSAEVSEKVADTVVLSKLLNKFTSFLPFIKVYMENQILRHQNLQMLIETNQKNLDQVQNQCVTVQSYSKQLSIQLEKVKGKLLNQQKTLKVLRTKLKRLAAEQRLLKFLPKLRHLQSSQEKMAKIVQILMKKFVDPKMTLPMEEIYDRRFKFTSKKIAAARKQKWQRLEKYFGGITKMAKMNKKQISNNVAIIIGQKNEMNAVRECQKLGIKMFTFVDTDCNPKFSDHIIPVNDDSRNSVKFVLQEMLTHIRLAQKLRQKIDLRKAHKYSKKI